MKDRINQIMQQEGVPASQFAEKIGISPASLSHILNGRNEPSLMVVTKIHESCGVSLDWLVYGRGEMQDKPQKEENEDLYPGENTLFSSLSSESLENRKEMEVKMPFLGTKEIVREEVKYIEKPARKITEIRIFFDNGTYETFHPDK